MVSAATTAAKDLIARAQMNGNKTNGGYYIVSIDPGLTYFAYMTLDVSTKRVVGWEGLPMSNKQKNRAYKRQERDKSGAKLQKHTVSRAMPVNDLGTILAKLKALKFGMPPNETWSKDRVLFVIEQQPNKNPDMIKLQVQLMTFLALFDAKVVLMNSICRKAYLKEQAKNPAWKFYNKGRVGDARGKEEAIDFVRNLALDHLDKRLQSIFHTARKKDDVADCFVQLLAAIDKDPSWLWKVPEENVNKKTLNNTSSNNKNSNNTNSNNTTSNNTSSNNTTSNNTNKQENPESVVGLSRLPVQKTNRDRTNLHTESDIHPGVSPIKRSRSFQPLTHTRTAAMKNNKPNKKEIKVQEVNLDPKPIPATRKNSKRKKTDANTINLTNDKIHDVVKLYNVQNESSPWAAPYKGPLKSSGAYQQYQAFRAKYNNIFKKKKN